MHRSLVRALAPVAVVTAGVTLLQTAPAGAELVRTSGQARSIDVGWTEYDLDDRLGLPGNVHVGYLYAESGPYGDFLFGSVTDFECDPGEVPYGGHHVVTDVVDHGSDVVADATEDAIETVIDSGASEIPAEDVVAGIGKELGDEIPTFFEHEFEETPACDIAQERFLSIDPSTVLSISKDWRATISGRIVVSGGHGDHGEPTNVLGRPPINVSITGGEWNQFESSWFSKGADYSYRHWQKGISRYGGQVGGAIGAMGFADDADDLSHGGFSTYRFTTVERVR